MRHISMVRGRVGARRPMVLLAPLMLLMLVLGVYGTSGAAFSALAANAANTFATDTLDPPGSFSAGRPCTPLGPDHRASTTKSVLAGSSLSLTTPATAPGDYLIMSVMAHNSGGNAVPTINTPAGWTSMGSTFSDGANTDVRLAVFGLAAPASPPASYSVSFSTLAVAGATLTSYSGVAGPAAWTGNTGATATAVAPSLSAATSNKLFVTVFAHTGTTSSTPTGMTLSAGVDASGAGLDEFHELRSVAGVTGTRSSTINATQPAWVAFSTLLDGTASGYDPTVNLSWTISPDTWPTGYEIVRSPGTTTAVSGRSTATWTDTTTSSGTGYTYTIRATGGNWRSTARNVTVNAC